MDWEYVQPVKVIFGRDARLRIAEYLSVVNSSRALLVCGRSMVRSGMADELCSAAEGKIIGVFSEIQPNPTVDNVNACAGVIRDLSADCVIAMGGGSVIDCAKAACGIANTNDGIEKYHGTGVPLTADALPLIAMPSTAGTGSEVTCVSVLTNEQTHLKAPLLSPKFYAKLAVVDPVLTYSTPARVTASTGFDVLCHAIEGFYSVNHQPAADALCIYAAGLAFKWIERACSQELDMTAKDKMAEASLIAGLGFNLPKTGASHACSFVLTNEYHIPHGEACILTQDFFVRVIAAEDGGRLDEFAQAIGFEDANEMADRICELKVKLGVRKDLKDLALDEQGIARLVAESRHPNMKNSPVYITDDMLTQMYKSLS